MSKKRTNFSAEFKAKLVLELLEEKESLNQIASKYQVLPKNLVNWKKVFLENMSLAFDKSTVVKEYKEKIENLEKDKDCLARKVGNLSIEKDFLEGKLKSSVSFDSRKTMLDTGLKLSINKQLKLLSLSKTALYYKPVKKFSRQSDIKLLNRINELHEIFPYYGYQRLWKQLLKDGKKIGRKRVISACKYMGVEALYPKPRLSIANKEHEKYPYLLNAFKNDKNQVIINESNIVWSTDITYLKTVGGMCYLAAIIDWGTKKVLSWRLSNTMDVSLTVAVLNEALSLYPKPDIVNTDQGSQYTAKAHVEILKRHKISISMNGVGRSTDNICIERFWRSLKYEDVYLSDYKNMSELKLGIEKYINLYNSQRIHSSIDYRTPDEVYFLNNSYDEVA